MRFFLILSLFFGGVGALGSREGFGVLIQAIVRDIDPGAQVGMEIQTLDGQEVFSWNSHQSYPSASVQKIFPSALALAVSREPNLLKGFDESFEKTPFSTEIYYDCKKRISYLVFGGDPLLTTKDLSSLFQRAKEKGMLGDTLYIVTGHSPHGALLPPYSPGGPSEGLDFCYGVSLVPALINGNEVRFHVRGGEGKKKAEIIFDDSFPVFQVKNDSYLRKFCFKDQTVGPFEQVQRDSFHLKGSTLHVRGCVPEAHDFPMCIPVGVDNLEFYLRTLLEKILTRQGTAMKILFQQEFSIPEKFEKISHSSSSLQGLLKLALKDSDNLAAESLFARLTHRPEWPRNWVFAGQVLKDHIERIFGLSFSGEDVIEGGSGFSLYNRLTPHTVASFLTKAYHKLGDEFVHLLAEGGADGTLKNRFKKWPHGKIFAKTGSHRNLTALAGYFYGKGKTPYVMSIFVVGKESKKTEHRRLIETLISTFLENLP